VAFYDMIDQKTYFKCLSDEGVELITGVPDSLLNEFCSYAESILAKEKHVIAANEGNAIALAAGYHLATGTIPFVYMQNSGIANAMNPLLSLTNREVYSIPMVLLIGWRGDPEINDHAQHQRQGKITPDLFQIIDIPYRVLDSDDQSVIDSTIWAIRHAKTTNRPTALLAKKGLFEKGKKSNSIDTDNICINRETAIKCIVDCLPEDTIYVAATGRATRELYYLRENTNEGHANDFLNVGAMGHTSQIALGIALGNTKRLVVCLDGDASAIMHLGGFSTIGKVRPSNLLHVVLNNGVHESVGGQPSAGYHINLTAIAEKSGYATIGKAVKSEQELRFGIHFLIKSELPAFIDIHIQKGTRSNLKALTNDLISLKEQLMKELAADKV
jgi:phosphonopyruvate decarboxylase